MTRCNRHDCGGVIDEHGFCTECDQRPLPESEPEPEPEAQEPQDADRPAASVGVAQARSDPWWGLELAQTGHIPSDAFAPVRAQAHLSEERRYCENPECRAPVGRGHGGKPGRIQGFCPRCGTEFDFSRLLGGETIAGRYDVIGVLGAGGQGTAYLVHDRNLDADVVLKALHESVAKTTLRERNALFALRHDSIVRILSYEPEGPYLVLEHVPGERLSARADDPLDVILAHGLQVLQALDYLHARGLLHCDVNPSNIMRFAEASVVGPRDRVRLIDFGAVRTLGDASPASVYTHAYAPPKWNERTRRPDPEHARPTAGFDLFCLGRTLEELCRRPLRDQLAAPGVDSLRRLLLRATDTDIPERRFVSARQFAEQLSGVIRQIAAAPPARRRVTRPSVLFGSMTEPMHGGLGAPRPLEHWITARVVAVRALEIRPPFASPTPPDIAAALPTPLADPDDTRTAGNAEHALAECRAALRHGSADAADRALARAGLPGWHWLHSWYAGLIALVRQDAEAAADRFAAVRDLLPGELIPLLALGLCAESGGDLTIARLHYETVADTAPALGAAGFGLARVHLLAGRRKEAVDAARRLALEFRFEREALIAAVRLLVAIPASPAGALPSDDELGRAQELLADLDVKPAERTGLRTEIQYARFVTAGGGLELSETVREAAADAATERDYVALVDLANRLRPPIEWRLRGIRRRDRRTPRSEYVS